MIEGMATSSDTTSKTSSAKSAPDTAPDTAAPASTTPAASASPRSGDRDTETIAPGAISNAPLADSVSPIPRDDDGRIIPTPGDVRTEPVATAQESHVAGRVGPRTIAEDSTSAAPLGEGLDEIDPGRVLADTPEGTGPVPVEESDDPQGEALADLDRQS